MSNSSMADAAAKVFTSVNKSMMDGDIINGSLNAMQNMAGQSQRPSATGGMSFQDQSDFLKNWYSLDSGVVANCKA